MSSVTNCPGMRLTHIENSTLIYIFSEQRFTFTTWPFILSYSYNMTVYHLVVGGKPLIVVDFV